MSSLLDWKELVGMSATVLIFIGFLGKGEKFIRIFNLIGSAIFVVYGLLIGAPSVWVLNGACAVLNIVKLFQQFKK